MKSALNEARRARPLLGTFVEVRARGEDYAALHRAIDRAFRLIKRAHCLMSFHDPNSDVGRLNGAKAGRAVSIDEWTYEVLQQAQHFAEMSAGCFDVTIAPTLVKWGFLPRSHRSRPPGVANYRKIELLDKGRVRFSEEGVMIDLGGIAKGFAVDKAIGELKQCVDVDSALVNAGGDLRAFGSHDYPVAIRHPRLVNKPFEQITLRDGALATSAHYFAQKRWRGHKVSPIVNPNNRQTCFQQASVSVRAETCLRADAFTKIVMVCGEPAFSLLTTRGAEACLFTREGQTLYSSGWQ